jgi:hypothetical protein
MKRPLERQRDTFTYDNEYWKTMTEINLQHMGTVMDFVAAKIIN